MQDQPSDDYKQLEKAFIAADDAFRNDHSVVYGNEQQKAKVHFDHFRRLWQGWDDPGQCMYRGCTNASIRRSHSIQKSAHLESLAEEQHVLAPRLDHHQRLGMKRIGINLASTFPGFCERHEQIFAAFEAQGRISEPRHVALQAFRTLCREVFRKKREIADMESTLAQYRGARSDYYAAAVKDAVPDMTIKRFKIEGDGLERLAVSRLADAKRVLRELEGDLYEELFTYVNDARQEPCLRVLSLPFEVPIACSGFGNLTYRHRERNREAFCPLGILPQVGTTIAYFVTAWKHSAVADLYFARMGAGFGALNAMESWLVNGSDHWFMRPSAWASIPGSRQQKILDQIMSDDDNIGSFLKYSILDDARNQMINWVREGLEELEPRDRRKISKMLDREAAKLLP